MIRVSVRVRPPILASVLVPLLESDPEVVLVEGDADADVVLLSPADPENDEDAVSLLFRSPRTRVVALGAGARTAFLYEMRPHRAALGELSRETLLAALRPGAAA